MYRRIITVTFNPAIDKSIYEDKISFDVGGKGINVSKVLANSDEISLDNEVEVAEIDKNGGAPTDSIPGNYIPGKAPYQEPDDSMAPTVIVTPNTGDNLNFIIPVIVGVVALVILGVGVILIKKKTL